MSGFVIHNHRSRFVTRVRKLDPKVVSGLQVTDAMLTLCDVVISVCRALSDDSDPRPWQERLESCFTTTLADIDHGLVREGLLELADGGLDTIVAGWTTKANRATYRGFVRRMLGTAEYDRLVGALKEDAAVVVLAVRRGVRAAMPLSVAWQDALAVLSPDQLQAVAKGNALSIGALDLLIELDRVLGEKMLPELPMELTSATAIDLSAVDNVDLVELSKQFRVLVSADSLKRVERVNAYLVRKINGARDALEYSADGVSQAANSLIELIDRLLREAFDKTAVLAWLDENLPGGNDLCYRRDGVRYPTKRAEALCFVYAGGSVTRVPSVGDDGKGPSLLHDVLSRAIVAARDDLQRLKHADADDVEGMEAIRVAFASVEGSLMLALRLSWSTVPDARLRGLAPDNDLPALS